MSAEIADELRRAINRGMEGAGTLPAKEAVKVRPSDWHAIIDSASAAIDALDAKDKRIAELEAALKPFARVGHMMVFAGATADNEIELSGEELHPALLAASRSLPNKEDRNG